jgi:hypothetical protein
MVRNRIAALLCAAATALPFASNSTRATDLMPSSAQDFSAAHAKGEFTSQQKRQPVQRTAAPRQARIPVPSQTQQVSVPQMNALAGLNLGGSWLASNMGASRPSGAPGAWCGYAMRMEMVSQGHGDPGPEFNAVSHWCRVGTAAPVGAVGSIFVSRGHVSKVVAGDCPAGTVATISGNATGRRVSHMCEPVSRAVCSRWPGKVNS